MTRKSAVVIVGALAVSLATGCVSRGKYNDLEEQKNKLEANRDALSEELVAIQAERQDLEQEQSLIRREAKQEIDAAISSYKWKNMLFTPILVILVGFAVGLTRKLTGDKRLNAR